MADAIIYTLPDGRSLVQDPNRVFLIPSDNGVVELIDSDSLPTQYRVGKTKLTYQTNEQNEITGALARINLEHLNEGN